MMYTGKPRRRKMLLKPSSPPGVGVSHVLVLALCHIRSEAPRRLFWGICQCT